jgi:hypothetical protein
MKKAWKQRNKNRHSKAVKTSEAVLLRNGQLPQVLCFHEAPYRPFPEFVPIVEGKNACR